MIVLDKRSLSKRKEIQPLVIIPQVLYSMGHHKKTFDWHHESEVYTLAQWLPALRIVQIILCLGVITFILLQVRGAGLGSVFGGSSAGSVFKTRRGVERLIFNITIVFVILFGLISLVSLIIH